MALVLLLKALIPAGYMLDPARAVGAWPVVLCPDGLPPMLFALAPTFTHDDSHHAGHTSPADDAPNSGDAAKTDGECAFVGLSAPAIGANAPVEPSKLPLRAPPRFAAFAAIGRGLAAPPPPSTGPPRRF